MLSKRYESTEVDCRIIGYMCPRGLNMVAPAVDTHQVSWNFTSDWLSTKVNIHHLCESD